MRFVQLTFLLVLLFILPVPGYGAEPDGRALWERYQQNFIQPDGRVVDRQQQELSHSESQGYGLLLALRYGDRPTFQSIWRWTHDNLAVRGDGLLAWAWGRRENGQWGVVDYNNATDGDLLVAYALLQAAERWGGEEYRQAGLAMVRAIRTRLATTFAGESYLLPAYYGFPADGRLVVNPSYLIFPAYRAFAGLDDQSFWDRLYRSGLELVMRCSFGPLQLPPDWAVLDGAGIAPWSERSPTFGFEAVRVFLYLSWEPEPRFPAGLAKLLRFYRQRGYLPASVDLQRKQISIDEASAGVYAVMARAAELSGQADLALRLRREALERSANEVDNYYSMSLLLLALDVGGP